MDMKEMGVGSVVVVGGMAFGFSQYGLNSVLSEDLKHITEVSQAEMPAYMETVTSEFQSNFSTYQIPLETYTYDGLSKFTYSVDDGTFIENITSEEAVPKEGLKDLKKFLGDANFKEAFCLQDEMTMFTSKGWNYRFMVEDSNGRNIATMRCFATSVPSLRTS